MNKLKKEKGERYWKAYIKKHYKKWVKNLKEFNTDQWKA